jgi:hypothetical protein
VRRMAPRAAQPQLGRLGTGTVYGVRYHDAEDPDDDEDDDGGGDEGGYDEGSVLAAVAAAQQDQGGDIDMGPLDIEAEMERVFAMAAGGSGEVAPRPSRLLLSELRRLGLAARGERGGNGSGSNGRGAGSAGAAPSAGDGVSATAKVLEAGL